MARRQRIGLLGGTFDPIHAGHMAIGRAAVASFDLDRLVVIPTGHSWQKADAATSPDDRLEMARIAVAGVPTGSPESLCRWEVDDIETRRSGPSYTVDTLALLRHRFGPEAALVLILGSDQLRNLASWHRWQELLVHAHIAATQRERVPLSELPAEIDGLVARCGAASLPDAPSGTVVLFRMPAVPVSATALRRALAGGDPVDGLLPPGVEDYIRRHGLYAAGLPTEPPDPSPVNPAGRNR